MDAEKQHTGQAAGADFDAATKEIMPDTEVTRLRLLRHGAVEQLERREVRGQLDHPLSDVGRDQSQRLADWIGRHAAHADRVLTSDLSRCTYLAQAVADRIGARVELEPRLREQHMGRWQGHTWEEITEWDAARVTAYWDDYANTRPADGESLADLAARVGAWWDETLATSHGQTLIVVTHVGVVRSMLCRLLDFPLDSALRLAPATASHTSLLHSAAGSVLDTFGERPWLT